MSRLTLRDVGPAAGLAFAAALACSSGLRGQNFPDPDALARSEPGRYVGIATCGTANCHGSTLPKKERRVLQNEYFTWDKLDSHRRAYEVLFDARSATILRNLRLAGPAYQTKRCLDCHALVVPERLQAARLEVEDGLSCESCHGPASGWLEGHRAEGWTHADSVRAGMRDLRDFFVRAGLCLSCHQGDATQTVDHELIAAGHPVLSFELDNYTRTLPPHWRVERENGARAWSAGQATAFASGLARLAAGATTENTGRWPEFSELSCTPCHHALGDPGKERWRSERPPESPGLPRTSPARWAVLRHLVAAFAPEERAALDAGVAELGTKTIRFGTPAGDVAKAAEALLPSARRAALGIAHAEIGEPEIRSLLLAIATDRSFMTGPDADVATAEQVYLALHTLSAELLARLPPRAAARTGLPTVLEQLAAELEVRNRFDPGRFAERLKAFEARVRALR